MTRLALGLLLPVLLILLALFMERIERPLTAESRSEQLDLFLATARPDEVETFVSEGYAAAIDMYWRNRPGRRGVSRRGIAGGAAPSQAGPASASKKNLEETA